MSHLEREKERTCITEEENEQPPTLLQQMSAQDGHVENRREQVLATAIAYFV